MPSLCPCLAYVVLVSCSLPLTRSFLCFFFNHTASTAIYTLSLHDALPILVLRLSRSSTSRVPATTSSARAGSYSGARRRSEEHTSELQSLRHLVCRLLLEKKKKKNKKNRRSRENRHSR